MISRLVPPTTVTDREPAATSTMPMELRAAAPALIKIEVECDRLEQVREAVAAKADVIMLDNMPLDTMREAVKFVGGKIPLEASGGVRFDTVRAIAETGVDFISSSKMIQAAPAVDIGLDEA